MSITTLRKVNVFSIFKELYESLLIYAKLLLILYVIPLFSLTKYLILILTLLNLSILSNRKRIDFAPVEVLYEMS